MGNWDNHDLTPVVIWQIAFEAKDGEADPGDAKRLLEFFCDMQEGNRPIPKELLLHLRQAFRAYLDGSRSIESGLGLVRKKARPKADPKMRTMMALAILKLRLEGSSHQDALAEVEDLYKYGMSVIGQAWREYKTEAWCLLRLEQKLGSYPEKPNQVERLEKILGKCLPLETLLGPIASEKSPTKAA